MFHDAKSNDKSKDINVVFKGIVDKIMYKEIDGKTYISIVDYKTGNKVVDGFEPIMDEYLDYDKVVL